MKKFKISIHPLFLIFAAVLIYLGYFYILLAYLITIILHEFAHSFVANRLGYRLNIINIMPHGASLSGQSHFFSVRDEILDFIPLAEKLINFLKEKYLVLFNNRYPNCETLEDIAKLRKFVVTGGDVDMDRTAYSVVDDFRKGRIGKITLD